MIRILQVLLFVVLSAVFFGTVLSLWLGLAPELRLLEYLSGWQAFGAVLSTFALYAGLIAYVFGWNPQNRLLHWLRSKLLLPAMTRAVPLAVLLAVLSALAAAEAGFLMRFDAHHDNPVLAQVWSENYAAADRELAGLDATAADIAHLLVVNDAIRQQFLSTSQGADKDLCRIYNHYFQQKNLAFRPAWERFSATYANASCMQVLENPKAALDLYGTAMRYARWLGLQEERRTARKMAAIYFADVHGVSGIKDRNERHRHIVTLIGSDPQPTAQRMLGASYYQVGEFAKAAETWNTLLSSIPPGDAMERKKLRNNIALAYAAQHQHSLALETLEAGLASPFREEDESERREQIRLLSTKALVQLYRNDCAGAAATWKARNTLRRQALTKCTALISAQVLACETSREARDAVFENLLLGIGQDPGSFKDPTREALVSLIEQGEKVFAGCYLGLTLRTERIRNVVLGKDTAR
jgi:hypothetical protein